MRACVGSGLSLRCLGCKRKIPFLLGISDYLIPTAVFVVTFAAIAYILASVPLAMGLIPFAIVAAIPSAAVGQLVLIWLNCRPRKREQRLTAWGHALGILLFVALTASASLAVVLFVLLRPVAPTFPEPDEVRVLAVADEPWDLRDLEGRPIDLRSLRGKVVFLGLWSPG